MSIGEWINLYQDGDLDIHPEFQRFFRWTDQQKSNLIESILLGIPLPPIFVSQRKDGVWDVIDGLQRLSTIFQFIGILQDENRATVPALQLRSTNYLPSLKDICWESEDEALSLPDALRRVIKRTKIHVSIVLKEALLLSVLGFFPGFGASLGLYTLIEHTTKIIMDLNPYRVVSVFLLTVLMCVIAGMLAVKKVLKADPAELF